MYVLCDKIRHQSKNYNHINKNHLYIVCCLSEVWSLAYNKTQLCRGIHSQFPYLFYRVVDSVHKFVLLYSLDSSAHFTWSILFATKRTIWLSFQCKKHIVVVRVRYVPSRWDAYCVGVLWVIHNIPYLFTITLLCLGCFLVYDTWFRDLFN